MDDYLAKPIRPADVRGMIEKWALPRNSATVAKINPRPCHKIETPPRQPKSRPWT
jgi:hypothetical protein